MLEAVRDGKPKIRTQAPINKRFGLFRGHKGAYTSAQAAALIAAAENAMRDPRNRVGLREKILGRVPKV